MSPKKVSIKVYLSSDDEIYKRIEVLSEKTTLSFSSLAGFAMRRGLASVEEVFQKMMDGVIDVSEVNKIVMPSKVVKSSSSKRTKKVGSK